MSQITFEVFIKLGKKKQKRNVFEDENGHKFILFRRPFTAEIPTVIANEYKVGRLYTYSNIEIINNHITVLSKNGKVEKLPQASGKDEAYEYIMTFINNVAEFDENFFKEVHNYLIHNYDFDGFRISMKANVDLPVYKKPDFLQMKLKTDGTQQKKMFCKYSTYSINDNAEDFKDLLVVDNIDYVKNNYRPNSCVLTAILNKLHLRFNKIKSDGKRAYKELTYSSLCKMLGIPDKDSDNEVSIKQLYDNFIRHYSFISFHVYNCNMELLFERKSECRDVSSIRVMVKDRHMYLLNDNLKELEKQQTIDYTDDERSLLNVSNQYHILYKETDIGEVDKQSIIYCKTSKDITTAIKESVKNNDKKLKVITSTDMSELLLEYLKAEYTPFIRYSTNITDISIKAKKTEIHIQSSIIESQYGVGVNFETVEEYREFEKANIQFYSSIITDKLMSNYHPSVIEIEKEYNINAPCGAFEDNLKCNFLGLDENKAYAHCLKNISQVPVFSVFDTYKPYDGHKVEDLTQYIVKVNSNSIPAKLIFNKRYSRTYGYVLSEINNISYDILYYRRPEKVEKVNYAEAVNELFNNQKIGTEEKKQIVCITTGLLEKKRNTSYFTKVFYDYDEANCYAIKYNGELRPFYTYENEPVEEYDPIDNRMTTTYSTKIKDTYYIVKISKEETLVNGFNPIKDLIYSHQRLKLYRNYNKLNALGVNVYGCKTDCLYFHRVHLPIVRNNFPLTQNVGEFKIEKDKTLSYRAIELIENTLTNFKDYTKANVKTFADEYDLETIGKFYNNNKLMMIRAKYAGSGKSYSIYKTQKNILTILPENTLCRRIRKNGYDAITFNKLFSLFAGDIEIANIKKYDVSKYEVIFFDEIAKYSPERLKRIYKFIQEHPEKKVFCAGDCKQIKPIGYRGSQEYLDECINVMFNNQVYFTEIKRCKKEQDKQLIKNLYTDIFENNITDIKVLCEKHNIKTETDITKLKTTQNLAYFNQKCKNVSNIVHYNILKHQKKYFDGLMLICKKYYNANGVKLNLNYSYQFKKFVGNNVILFDDVENEELSIPRNIVRDNFIYPYCITIDSSQGMSIDEPITIFNLENKFVDVQRLWVAITRATDISNITIFLDNKDDDIFKNRNVIDYFNNKIQHYKHQDDVAGRQYNNENYVDYKWITKALEEAKMCCCHCGNVMELSQEDNKIESNITIDRIDNSKGHLKDNCIVSCFLCNCTKGNRNN